MIRYVFLSLLLFCLVVWPSHIAVTLVTFPFYFNERWLWCGIIIRGQGCRVLLGDVVSCGRHQPSCPNPPIPPPPGRASVDIPVGQFNKKNIMGHTRLKRSIAKCGSDCQVSVALMYFLLSVQWSCLISLQWDLIGTKNGPSWVVKCMCACLCTWRSTCVALCSGNPCCPFIIFILFFIIYYFICLRIKNADSHCHSKLFPCVEKTLFSPQL